MFARFDCVLAQQSRRFMTELLSKSSAAEFSADCSLAEAREALKDIIYPFFQENRK